MENQFEEVNVYHEVQAIKKEIRTDSYFDGGLLELIGWKVLAFLISVVTLGFGAPWATCMVKGYEINHTVFNGKRLKFEGTGGDYFVHNFKWVLLGIITLGIYFFLVPVRRTRWFISNIHFEDEDFIKDKSFFDGKTIQLIGINILSSILNFVSFGLLSAFTYCFKLNWIVKHTVINRKKIVFTGTAISLFLKRLLWGFLTAITFGIFGLWVPIKMLKWQGKNIHIKVVGEAEPEKDKSLYIAIPVLVVGIVIFTLVITLLIGNFGGSKSFDIDNIFKGNFLPKSSQSGNINGENIAHIDSTQDKSAMSNDLGKAQETDKVLSGDYSELSGTYVDVFGGDSTMNLDANGIISFSNRDTTITLTTVEKMGDGSYFYSIPGGEVTIYPAGVSSNQGDTSKVRVNITENGGALCYQKK